MANPIQIVLNPEDFETDRVGRGGASKDFFADRDTEFHEHKNQLLDQIGAASEHLSSQSETDIGYMKVTMRRQAWAKSHRPITALFKKELTPIVGGTDLGVMLVEVKPTSISSVARRIQEAESKTKKRINPRTGREKSYPTRTRSEVSAISKVELFSKEDKRSFSVEQAIKWLSRADTGGNYEVELFRSLPVRSSLDALDESHQRLFLSFAKGLAQFGTGLVANRRSTKEREQPRLSVRLGLSDDGPILRLAPSSASGKADRSVIPFDASIQRHAQLLQFLDTHPLVRRISLPGIIVPAADEKLNVGNQQAKLPPHSDDRTYPRLAIIDGGLGTALDDWTIGKWDTIADEDADLAHGSFIGGLAVAGRTLNGESICGEPDGTELMDIAILPDTDKPEAFSSYYPEGISQFFEELGNAVGDAKDRHDVRIFNMSMNIQQPAAPNNYSTYAAQLDRISDENDALFFISAGNTDPQDTRPEWSTDDIKALAAVAAARNDGILMPAESVRNVSVAALNPPSHPVSVPYAPARYSRRGPGLRAGVKPDFAHVGGSGSPVAPEEHGLFAVLPDGTIVSGCGTSYATPLVAKTAAELDHAIEGHVSRETLVALLVHGAQLPEPLNTKTMVPLARQMVGFGVPATSQQILESEDHQITLVFATRIRQGQQLSFRFPWPQSLTSDDGACRGKAKLTLVSSPPLDTNYGAEFVRVNLEGALQQENDDGKWKGRLESETPYLKEQREVRTIEAELVKHRLKWSAVKVYEKRMPMGVGRNSNWRLAVNYLTRAGETMPSDGVTFTAILTISDIDKSEPVFTDMRQTLNTLGVRTADIRIAARITPRV